MSRVHKNRIKTFILIAIVCSAIGCDQIVNNFDDKVLHCGDFLDSSNLKSIFRFESPQGDLVRLSQNEIELIDEQSEDVDHQFFQISSGGCLLIFKEGTFHMSIPGSSLYVANLTQQEGLQTLRLVLDQTEPEIRFVHDRIIFPALSTISIDLDKNVRARYCIEFSNVENCNVESDPRTSFRSQEFLTLTDLQIPLPNNQGSYLLHVIAQNRQGNFRRVTKAIRIDDLVPHITPDFVESFKTIIYEEQPHFYLPTGYQLGFLSNNFSVFSMQIEYCLKQFDDLSNECNEDEIKAFHLGEDLNLTSGRWRLFFRARSEAGNLSHENWASKNILVQVTCPENLLYGDIESFIATGCTDLIGSVYLNRLPIENWILLELLVRISGSVQSSHFEDLTEFPQFKNLRYLTTLFLERNDNLERIEGFGELIELSNIQISSSYALISIKGFHKLKNLRLLKLRNNHVLERLDGLGKLENISYEIQLTSNPKLRSIEFLAKVPSVRTLLIQNMDSLFDLTGFRSLRTVHWMRIEGNHGLTDLNGLQNLTSAYSILIMYNDSLTNLRGLENLKEVSTLSVRFNEALTDRSAIDHLTN